MILMLAFLALTIVSLFFYFRKNPNFVDFNDNRICCGYVLRGINPLKNIGKNPIPELGVVPWGFGNLPYGLLLGNLFYFGFLDIASAKICFYIMTFIMFVLLLIYAFRFFKYTYISHYKLLFLIFALLSVFSINVIASIRCGNVGHIVCMLVLLTIFTMDSSPIVSGIFLSLAMIKPQISFPFCVVMLISKKILPLFIAASIDVISSLVVSYLVNENILELFRDFFNAKVGGNKASYGILTFLYKENYFKALIPSMVFGIVLLIVAVILLKNNKNILILYSIPAIVCSIWSYSWSSDHFILILAVMAFIFILVNYNLEIIHIVFVELFVLFDLFIVSVQSILKVNSTINLLIKQIIGIGGYIGASTVIDLVLLLSLVYLVYINNKFGEINFIENANNIQSKTS